MWGFQVLFIEQVYVIQTEEASMCISLYFRIASNFIGRQNISTRSSVNNNMCNFIKYVYLISEQFLNIYMQDNYEFIK